jgi:hypothetical protein
MVRAAKGFDCQLDLYHILAPYWNANGFAGQEDLV